MIKLPMYNRFLICINLIDKELEIYNKSISDVCDILSEEMLYDRIYYSINSIFVITKKVDYGCANIECVKNSVYSEVEDIINSELHIDSSRSILGDIEIEIVTEGNKNV